MRTAPLPIPFQPLYPSQRSGIATIHRANWRGEECNMVVQWHEDRAYFSPLEGRHGVWATIDSCEENDAVACFEQAVRERRYGICFVHWTEVHPGRGDMGLDLQFIYAPDGTGFLREWTSRQWIAFEPKETRGWVLFPDLELPRRADRDESFRCCQYAASSVRDEILLRKVGQQEIEHLTWRSPTSEEEFKIIGISLWNAGFFRVRDIHRKYSGLSLFTYNNSTQYRSRLSITPSEWNGKNSFWKWMGQYFSGEGFYWRPTDWGKRRYRKLRAREPHLRAFFAPHGVNWNVSFANRSEPSFHEQLEARLELREWLWGKVSAEQIEDWLQT